MDEVGQVISSDKGCFSWIIDDFFSHTYLNGGDEELKSPEFKFSDTLCDLSICFRREGLLRLYFAVRKKTSHTLHVRLGMKTGHRGKKETRSEVIHPRCSDWRPRRLDWLPRRSDPRSERLDHRPGLLDHRSGRSDPRSERSDRRSEIMAWETRGYRERKETRSREVNTFGYFSVVDWMPCSEMLERRSEILPNGRLTVSCEISTLYRGFGHRRELDIEDGASVPSTEQYPSEQKVVVENETSDEEEESTIESKVVRKLLKDLNNLLKTGEDSDVTIKVQGKEFPAHKNILRARSPVFRSMFSHEMVEKQSGVVVVDDCDSATFPDFLKCVYTGSTRHICDENVYHLYTASDKYGIDELKGECAEFMKNNLSVGRFCDTITLALRHNEEELVGLATAFFCENAIKITKTAKWQVFLHENTTAGNELFIKFASKGKDI